MLGACSITNQIRIKMGKTLFEKIWNAGQQSLKEMLESNEAFLEQLERFEQQIEQKPFKERVLNHLQND